MFLYFDHIGNKMGRVTVLPGLPSNQLMKLFIKIEKKKCKVVNLIWKACTPPVLYSCVMESYPFNWRPTLWWNELLWWNVYHKWLGEMSTTCDIIFSTWLRTCGKIIRYVLPYKVKTQYVQISNIVDTSIKHAISSQSTPMVKGFLVMFDNGRCGL